MTKKEMIDAIAAKAGVEKTVAARVMGATFDVIVASMVKGDVRVDGFGTFKVRTSKARTGRNPSTGATVKIPARKRATFTAAKALKDRIA